MKHHYVPKFFLRRWANTDGKLYVFSIKNGRLVSKLYTPRYTGYETNLYSVNANAIGIPDDLLEQKLFGPIDNNAALVLRKLESHDTLSENDHISWTFFLSSLRMRQPDALKFLQTDGMQWLKQILLERDKETLPPGWPTTEQWFNRNFPGAIEAKALIDWLPRMIAHDGVTESFSGLKWWTLEFAPTAPKLLLSDLPIHWEGGFNNEEFLIHLPLGPNQIFFGVRSEQTKDIISQMHSAELIKRINLTTLASSSKLIWASTKDEAQAFIEQNIETIGKNVITFNSLA